MIELANFAGSGVPIAFKIAFFDRLRLTPLWACALSQSGARRSSLPRSSSRQAFDYVQ
jgi:hypothetical protein